MHKEQGNAHDSSAVLVGQSGGLMEEVSLSGAFSVICYDSNGEPIWEETFSNQVTTAGVNAVLDAAFRGSAYTATWYISLVDTTSFSAYSAADTMSSHAGWIENVGYSNANRPTMTFGVPSAGSSVASAVTFNINATSTIKGAFVTNSNTKSGTTGTLYSAGTFTGGQRTVASGDSLVVTYTTTYTTP